MDTGLDALKTASKKVLHEAAEETAKHIRNKIACAVAKSNDNEIMKTKSVIHKTSINIEEIIIPLEKR